MPERYYYPGSCHNCKKHFTALRPNARFCSDRCRYAHHSETERFPDRVCLLCDKEFKVKNKLQTFCSRKCRSEWHMWEKRFKVMEKTND